MTKKLRAWLLFRLIPQSGVVTLPDGTKLVRQSAEFYAYCYGEAYARWKGKPRTDAGGEG